MRDRTRGAATGIINNGVTRLRTGPSLAAALLLMLLAAIPCAAYAGEPPIRLEHIARVDHPHGYGVDFARFGKYLLVTNGESDRKLAVIDTTDPSRPRVAAESVLPFWRSDAVCVWGATAIIDLSGWLCPVDMTDPLHPRPLKELMWAPDPPTGGQPTIYQFAVANDHLFLATPAVDRLLRIYRLSRPFKTELRATLDISPILAPGGAKWFSLRSNGGTALVRDLTVNGSTVQIVSGAGVFGIDIRDLDHPTVAYSVQPGEFVESAVRTGNRLFVATSNRPSREYPDGLEDRATASRRGILEVDLTDASQPRVLSESRDDCVAERLAMHGNVLVAAGLAPVPTESLRLGGEVIPADISGKYLGRAMVLRTLDVGTPGTPRPLGRLQFPPQYRAQAQSAVQSTRRMLLEGDTLYLAEQAFGLRVIDLSDPARLRAAGRLCTVYGESIGVLVRGNTGLLCAYTRLLPLDGLSGPNPTVDAQRSFPFPLGFQNRTLSSDENRFLATALADFGSLLTIDVTNIGHPILAEALSLPRGDEVRAIAVDQDVTHVLVASQRGLVFTLRTGRWTAGPLGGRFEWLGEVQLARFTRSVSWWGLTLFSAHDGLAVAAVATGEQGQSSGAVLIRADTRDPRRPRLIGAERVAGVRPGAWLAWSRFFDDQFAYLPGGGEGTPTLYVVEHGRGSAPRMVGAVTERRTSRYADALVLESRRYVLVQDYFAGLRIVDVADAANPRVIWSEPAAPADAPYRTIGWAAGVVTGSRVYCPRLDHLDVFEIRRSGG